MAATVIDRKLVEKVAKLSRLELSDEEIAAAEEKFKALLKHFESLEAVDTKNVEALFHFPAQLPLRPDLAEKPLAREKLLQNAPDHNDSAFRLPRVVGEIDS